MRNVAGARLKRNTGHWDVGVAYPSKVRFFSLVSIEAEENLFSTLIQRGDSRHLSVISEKF